MAEKITAEAFSRHLKTKFNVRAGGPGALELELDEVAVYPGNPGDQEGMERFSLFFYGPADPQLPQATHRLTHEAFGEVDIFLVPVARNERGHRYQAVFNSFK